MIKVAKKKYYFDEDDSVYALTKTEEEVWTQLQPAATDYYKDFWEHWNGKSGVEAKSVHEHTRACVRCGGFLRFYDKTSANEILLFCESCGKVQAELTIFGMTPKQRQKMEESIDGFVDHADVLYRSIPSETFVTHHFILERRTNALREITQSIEQEDADRLLAALQHTDSTLHNINPAYKAQYLEALQSALEAEKARIKAFDPAYTGEVLMSLSESGASPGLTKTISEVHQIQGQD
jgi:hypothetical protein